MSDSEKPMGPPTLPISESPTQEKKEGEVAKEEKEEEARAEEQLPPAQAPAQVQFQDGGYGWVVVAAVFILNAHTWGLNSSYAVFLAYYIRTNAFQTTDLGYAFIGGLSLSIAFLVSPIATFLAGWDKFGTRPTIFLGVIFEVIAFIGSSFASELWHIILSQGVSFGLGMGLAFVTSAPVPAQWFHKKRSLANGWVAAGSGFGGLTYSLATNAMIQNIGLAWTFRTLAIICFVVNGVASFFIRDRNKAVSSVHVAFNWALFKRPTFVLFQLWMALSLIGYTILVFSIVAYCQAVGLSPSQASLIGALFNLAQGIGRPAIGLSSDAVGRFNIANLSTLWCGLLCLFVWTFGARTFAGCLVFALLSGPVAGVMWATVSPICAEVVGLATIPSALSITWLVLVLPATFAEVIGLSLRTPGSWGYRDVQLFTGFMYVGAFVFGWALRALKVHELDRARSRKEENELRQRQQQQQQSGNNNDNDDDGDGENGGVMAAPSIELRRHVSRASTVKEKVLYVRGLWAVERV